MAMVMSEYRKYLFSDAGVNIKPVILFKSQRIEDSENFYDEFFEKLKSLSTTDLEVLYNAEIKELSSALDYFKEKDQSLMLLVNSLKDGFTKDKSIIMNGSADNTTEQQLQVNSLEDKDNPIRFIFAVDMLNEGWDVLNLFDIVRLYDTRQSGRKISSYTIKEAQLIGRGARYCPFKVDESQERFKRKYDYDLDNTNRILETMYFHSRDDSKYISELRRALVATGMQDEAPIKLNYELKSSFLESDLYKKGFVFSNSRIVKSRDSVKELEDSKKYAVFNYTISDTKGGINALYGTNNEISNVKMKSTSYRFKDINFNILSGAAECYSTLKFSVLKEKYPRLKTTREFLTSENYLGNNSIIIKYNDCEIKGKDIFNALIYAFDKISSYILSLKPEYEGSKIFKPHKLSDVIKNKSIFVSKIDKDGGTGESQNFNPNENYQLSLFDKDWYVFEDNYGTNQEKLFIKYFNDFIKPKLEEKDVKFFLIRNERVPELTIYSFSNGERFEPDFLLFVEKENFDKDTTAQVYIEPKGSHLLEKDSWKEKFLNQIEQNYEIGNTIVAANKDYIILGLPFFNSDFRMEEFEQAINKWMETM